MSVVGYNRSNRRSQIQPNKRSTPVCRDITYRSLLFGILDICVSDGSPLEIEGFFFLWFCYIVLTKHNVFAILSTMVKNIIHTQETFTILKEGKPDFKQNMALKLERVMYARVEPAWDKINYWFEHQSDMSGYEPK